MPGLLVSATGPSNNVMRTLGSIDSLPGTINVVWAGTPRLGTWTLWGGVTWKAQLLNGG